MASSEHRKQAEVLHGRAIADKADQVWNRTTAAGQRRVMRRFEDLKRRWGSVSGESLLEIGCGTGIWTSYLVQLGAQVTAIELSEDLLKLAGQRVPSARFLRADAERLPFEAGTFDKVCGLSILHHLDVPASLAEIARVLKPGGQVWFSEPNMLNPQIMIQKNVPVIKKWLGDTPDETAFFRWPLRRALQAAGFSAVVIEPFDFLHPQIPRAIVPAVEFMGRWMERTPLLREIAGSLLISARKPGATPLRK